jgi:hypothetical protein
MKILAEIFITVVFAIIADTSDQRKMKTFSQFLESSHEERFAKVKALHDRAGTPGEKAAAAAAMARMQDSHTPTHDDSRHEITDDLYAVAEKHGWSEKVDYRDDKTRMYKHPKYPFDTLHIHSTHRDFGKWANKASPSLKYSWTHVYDMRPNAKGHTAAELDKHLKFTA